MSFGCLEGWFYMGSSLDFLNGLWYHSLYFKNPKEGHMRTRIYSILFTILFLLVSGLSAYGQETISYEGNEYRVEHISKGRFLSHIAHERTLNGTRAGWEKLVIIHPVLGKIPTTEENAKLLPEGTKVLIPAGDVKTKSVNFEVPISVNEICSNDKNCGKTLTSINRLESPEIKISGQLWTLNNISAPVVLPDNPDNQDNQVVPRDPATGTGTDQFGFLDVLNRGQWDRVFYTLAIMALLAMGGITWELARTRKKLALIRDDVEHRLKRAAAFTGTLKIFPAQSAIVYIDKNSLCDEEFEIFQRACKDYRELQPRLKRTNKSDAGGQIETSVSLRFPLTEGKSKKRLSASKLSGYMRDRGEEIFAEFAKPETNSRNPDPMSKKIITQPQLGNMILQITPKNGNEFPNLHRHRRNIKEAIEEILDSRGIKDLFVRDFDSDVSQNDNTLEIVFTYTDRQRKRETEKERTK